MRCNTASLASRRKAILITATIMGWVAVVRATFWWLHWQHLKPFLDQAALFNGEDFSAELQSAITSLEDSSGQPITLIHFWQPDCPCNQFNWPHLQEIYTHYKASGVRFMALSFGDAANFPIPEFAQLAANHITRVPATPAVAVLNSDGELAYFGPYATGLLCSLGEGFAERVIDELQKGFSPVNINTTGVGCFCQTPHSASL